MYEELIGYEETIIEVSNKLNSMGCEDIYYFENWEQILDNGSVIVAIDETGEKHINIGFEIVCYAGEEEVLEATIIKITNVSEYEEEIRELIKGRK